MKVTRRFVGVVMLAVVLSLAALVLVGAPRAQYAPPRLVEPSADIQKKIEERKDKLSRVLAQFRQQGVHDPALADIEVYYKAASWITRHNEFYQQEAGEWT